MDKIMEKLNKLSLPAVILIASIIFGGFIYASQVNKQHSIEKQQQIELQAKSEQNKKEYAAKQKDTCLNIYQAESKKWNNVSGWNYNDTTDKCEITYKDAKRKTEAQCNKDFEAVKAIYKDEPVPPYSLSLYFHCLDGTFVKEF